MGHQLGKAHALLLPVGAGEIMLHPGIRSIQSGAKLLHDLLQPGHFFALGLIGGVAHKKALTADGGLEGDAVDIFIEHRHRFHQ